MTSAPTACPNHGEQVLTMFDEHTRCAFCGAPVDKPRQPDTSSAKEPSETAKVLATSVWSAYYIDAPALETDRELFKHAFECGHARASEEMGAEVYRLKIALDQKEFTLQNTFNQWQERCEQLAAAELKAQEYEAIVKRMANSVPDKQQCEMWDLQADACTVLAAHRRGGES